MLESVSPFFFALLCGLFAAAGTSLGGAVVFFVKDPTENFVSNANAAASGIMMFLCILDLVPDAVKEAGTVPASLAFLVGMVCFTFVHFYMHNSEYFKSDSLTSLSVVKQSKAKLLISAIVTTIVVASHNLPEGLAVLLAWSGSVERCTYFACFANVLFSPR